MLSEKAKICSMFALLGFIALSNIFARLIQSHTTQVAEDRCIYDTWRWTTLPITNFMAAHTGTNHVFIALDSFCIDIFALTFLAIYFWKGTIGVMYVTVLFYSSRGFSLLLGGEWPKPVPYIFSDPGFPSLFVPYDPTNDLYFSGHIGLCTCFSLLSFDSGRKYLGRIGIFVAFYTLIMLHVTGGHYFNDFIIGFCVAVNVALFVARNKYGYTVFVLKALCWTFEGVAKLYRRLFNKQNNNSFTSDKMFEEKLNSLDN